MMGKYLANLGKTSFVNMFDTFLAAKKYRKKAARPA